MRHVRIIGKELVVFITYLSILSRPVGYGFRRNLLCPLKRAIPEVLMCNLAVFPVPDSVCHPHLQMLCAAP